MDPRSDDAATGNPSSDGAERDGRCTERVRSGVPGSLSGLARARRGLPLLATAGPSGASMVAAHGLYRRRASARKLRGSCERSGVPYATFGSSPHPRTRRRQVVL